MTDDLRPPYRIAFDNARDPYTARNALGIGVGVLATRTITAGAGLTGGGDLSANRTIDVGAGTGITVNANDVALTVPVSVANGGTGSTTAGGGPFVQKAGDTTTGVLNMIGRTNGSAVAAGYIGEFKEVGPISGAVAITTWTNVASISLPAGDWDVWGSGLIGSAASTHEGYLGLSETSATYQANWSVTFRINSVGDFAAAIAARQLNFSGANRTIWFVAYGHHSAFNMNNVYIRARRRS